ncbi:hypothetical protein [Gayadomonas joobiniege]|uniref:hypothetical protein n=1 Tax=Gayadomonas joobiniege TaxID=1234606 RepID=UPI0012DBECF8|nr:hypothetical protein [Gayadomonas joobiniege]
MRKSHKKWWCLHIVGCAFGGADLQLMEPTLYLVVEIFVGWNRQRRFQQPATTKGVGDNSANNAGV